MRGWTAGKPPSLNLFSSLAPQIPAQRESATYSQPSKLDLTLSLTLPVSATTQARNRLDFSATEECRCKFIPQQSKTALGQCGREDTGCVCCSVCGTHTDFKWCESGWGAFVACDYCINRTPLSLHRLRRQRFSPLAGVALLCAPRQRVTVVPAMQRRGESKWKEEKTDMQAGPCII